MKKNLLLISLSICLSWSLAAQNIGINTATPDPSAKLDISATDAGLLIPRVALNNVTNGTTPINTPATSLLVYNTNAAVTGGSGAGFYYWNGTTWVRIGTDDWSITGNANTTAGTNFLGTTNGQALDFRTNNIQRFRVANGNQVYAMANGTALAPFYSRSTDANTGMYFSGADQISFAEGGIEALRITNNDRIRALNGSAAQPTWSFINDIDGGMYRPAANELGFSTGGTERVRIDAAGEVGIGTTTPNDDLDVIGRAQISEYLRVGNPAAPQTINPLGIQLYGMDAGSYYNGFTQGGCGAGWTGTITGNTLQDRGGLRWDNVGARGLRYLYSPFVWVPSGATQAIIEISHYCTLEDGFDGVYIEYSTDNGTTWTTVPIASFFLGGYNFFTAGSDATCTGDVNLAAWSGGQDNMVTAFPIPVSGTWLQVRFVAMEDASVGTGEYYLFNFNVSSDYNGGSHGGAFANGNIYAENNIYAGSNVLLGDLAEYFPVIGNSKPGDLISMVPSNNEKYIVTSQKHDSYVIGVHSTNPTLTLNDPNSGIPVGLQGRVPVNVVGPIKKGEYLTASDIPGHAMASNAPGYIVGRALESFDGKGKGQILCLLESGWYNPIASHNSTTGTITIQPNQTSIKVINPSMQKEAKVFVSMLGNPKTWYWLAKKSDGSFTIEFENPITKAVTFDYLIENASSVVTETVEAVAIQDGHQGAIAANTTNTATTSPKKDLNAPEVELLEIKSTFQIPERTNDSPPTVPDVNKTYIWSSHIGLQEQAVERAVSGQ